MSYFPIFISDKSGGIKFLGLAWLSSLCQKIVCKKTGEKGYP